MKINHLWIKRFRNLVDFEIDFDQDSFTTVLVGRNGSGKSNLLEAISCIFRNLDQREHPEFAYEMKYTRSNDLVEISADPSRKTRKTIVRVNAKGFPYDEFANRKRYLPRIVFSYYSGINNRMRCFFNDHEDQHRSRLLREDEGEWRLFDVEEEEYREEEGVKKKVTIQKWTPDAIRALFLATHEHWKYALLILLADEKKEMQDFLKDYFRILEIDHVLIEFSEPKKKKKPIDAGSSHPYFWDALSSVYTILDDLLACSTAPLKFENEKQGKIYIFLKNLETLRELTEKTGTQQRLFSRLENLRLLDLISNLRIKVKLNNAEDSIIERYLSEGEQQLITVVGLLRLTRYAESLFLLDEPDTHLNPLWSQEYLSLLKKHSGDSSENQILMATHDPLVICGLTKEEVRIMNWDSHEEKIKAAPPEDDPQGLGVAGLLKSDLFGLRTTLDLKTLAMIDRRNELYAKDADRTEDEQKEMIELSEELRFKGFTQEYRDPYYELFIKRMGKHKKFMKPALTPEETEEQIEIADKILDEILGEEAE